MDSFKQWKLSGLTEVEAVLDALHAAMKEGDVDVKVSYFDVVKAQAFIKTMKENV
jgi:hypothetical protein